MVKANGYSRTDNEGKFDPGSLNRTMSILNQRWTMHVVRGLLHGKMRFNEMVRAHGINPCTLRDRLRDLEHSGIIDRQVITTMPPNVEYSLTEKGMALNAIFVALEKWGKRWMTDEEDETAIKDVSTPAVHLEE